MKKVFACLVFFMFAVVLSAQETPKETAGDQISQVVATVFDKTTEAVTSLAASLKVPAERVYTVLTKQQCVKAIVWLVVVALFLLAGSILMYSANKLWSKANNEYIKANTNNTYKPAALTFFDDDHVWSFQWVFGLIIFIVGLIIFAASSITILTGFFNPEYGAIKEIMSIL